MHSHIHMIPIYKPEGYFGNTPFMINCSLFYQSLCAPLIFHPVSTALGRLEHSSCTPGIPSKWVYGSNTKDQLTWIGKLFSTDFSLIFSISSIMNMGNNHSGIHGSCDFAPLEIIAVFILHYNCYRIFKYVLGSLLLCNYTSSQIHHQILFLMCY